MMIFKALRVGFLVLLGELRLIVIALGGPCLRGLATGHVLLQDVVPVKALPTVVALVGSSSKDE